MILVNGFPIGQVNYNAVNKKDRSVELDILIAGKRDMGKGYGPDALKALTRYLFRELKIKKCFIKPVIQNLRAISAYKKAGFKVKKKVRQKGVEQVYMEKLAGQQSVISN